MKPITLDDINEIIETFEDFLAERDVRIPTSDEEMLDDGEDTSARIYGMDYGDLQLALLELFETWKSKEKVTNVIDAWNTEIEMWKL